MFMRCRCARKYAIGFVAAFLALGAAALFSPAHASPPFTQCPAAGADASCQVLIHIAPGGGLSVEIDSSQPPIDSFDDALVGVENDSNQIVPSITLSSPDPIFAFDNTGLCWDYPQPLGCFFGPTGYEGPGVSFSGINASQNSGTVNFTGGLAPGGSAYFTLDEALGATGTVPPSGVGSTGTANPQASVAEPVSTGNGNYYYRHTDLLIPGRGLPLIFERTYNSLDNYAGPLGANWTHSYNIVLTATPVGAVIKWGDGHGEAFTLTNGAFVAQPGVFSTLIQNFDGSFTLTQKNRTQYNFTSSGQLASISDRNGNSINLGYDYFSGNLTTITDTVGRTLTLAYDFNNRLVQIIDPASRTISYGYDGNGNLTQVTDPAGNITAFAYDSSHRVSSVALPTGALLLQNAYDGAGRVVSQTNGRGLVTTFAYDTPSAGETTITDPLGDKTVHTYDSALRIVNITDALGGAVAYTYDANNEHTGVTNQNGKTTAFTYDATGNVTSITDPLSNVSSFSYDTLNDLLTATNPRGKTTGFSYDGNGNLIAIQDAAGDTTTFTYDGFGELVSKTDAKSDTTTFSYDSSGDLVQITDALGDKTGLGYDAISRLVSVTDGNGHTATAAYDMLSRLTSISDPLGDGTHFTYDAIGNLLGITDANGHSTHYAYDAVNDLVGVTDALGHVTGYAYDGNNNRLSFTNAKGAATSYAYDALNRLVHAADPLGFATSYVYDGVGNVLAVTDANGNTNHFVYDALNRLSGVAYADGKTVSYSYDANGNRTAMTDSHGTTTYNYDTLDRLVSVSDPGAQTVSYTYDSLGNRQSLTYPDGKVVNYAYDAANRLGAVADWVGLKTTYAYDSASNLLAVDYPNNAAVSFAYDAANRLVNVTNYFGKPRRRVNPTARFTYALDAAGNRLKVTNGSGVTNSYVYDALNELISVKKGRIPTSFSYDAVGNRLSLAAPGINTAYSYDADDRLISAIRKPRARTTFTYDPNGNLTAKTAGRVTTNYTYDTANRLVAARSGRRSSSFGYDGDGNRIAQNNYTYVNDVATALTDVLQEDGPDGPITYERGLGLISASGSAFDFFYHYDGLGSVVGLTGPNGKLAGAYAYDAWGNAVPPMSNRIGTKNKFRFTGEALDPGTGLYYLRARYYDPSVGRFVNPDPFGGLTSASLSLNRYLYALNNPLVFTDPFGLFPLFAQTGWAGLRILGGLAKTTVGVGLIFTGPLGAAAGITVAYSGVYDVIAGATERIAADDQVQLSIPGPVTELTQRFNPDASEETLKETRFIDAFAPMLLSLNASPDLFIQALGAAGKLRTLRDLLPLVVQPTPVAASTSGLPPLISTINQVSAQK